MTYAKMSPREYRDIRKGLGLSQPELARLLGVHEMTISKRERGENPITSEAALALKMVEIEQKYDLEYE